MWFFIPSFFSGFAKRICPKCRQTQLVSKKDKDKTVICKNCGSAMPPPKKIYPDD